MTDEERSKAILDELNTPELGSKEQILTNVPLPDARKPQDDLSLPPQDPRVGDRY